MLTEQQRLLVQVSIEGLRSQTQSVSDRFYSELFLRAPQIEALFQADPAGRLTKFTNMLAILGNVKELEKLAPAIEALGRRHIEYGVKREHYLYARQALLIAVAAALKGEFTPEMREGWQAVLDGVIRLMDRAYADADKARIRQYEATDSQLRPGQSVVDSDLLEAIGGEAVIERVHRRFYNVIFEDPWLGKYFWGKSLEALVGKQTRFITACFGGENHYQGETPAIAHMHMYITDEMAELREHLLRQAILEEGLSEAVADRWIAVESAFRKAVVKQSVDECVMRCVGQRPVAYDKPAGYPWTQKGKD